MGWRNCCSQNPANRDQACCGNGNHLRFMGSGNFSIPKNCKFGLRAEMWQGWWLRVRRNSGEIRFWILYLDPFFGRKTSSSESHPWPPPYDDDCFYYHSWRNNVLIAFGTLSSQLFSNCVQGRRPELRWGVHTTCCTHGCVTHPSVCLIHRTYSSAGLAHLRASFIAWLVHHMNESWISYGCMTPQISHSSAWLNHRTP